MTRCYYEGPQGNPEKRLQSHRYRTQSPWKTKKAPSWRLVGMRAELSTLLAVCSSAHEVIKGVITLRFLYKMTSVYAPFPGRQRCYSEEQFSCGNLKFLEWKIHSSWVWIWPGVACSVFQAREDELILEGKDIDLVSNSVALIQQVIEQATTCKNKDIRTFWDGICVSEKGTVEQADE